jgi:hypothetical protein
MYKGGVCMYLLFWIPNYLGLAQMAGKYFFKKCIVFCPPMLIFHVFKLKTDFIEFV